MRPLCDILRKFTNRIRALGAVHFQAQTGCLRHPGKGVPPYDPEQKNSSPRKFAHKKRVPIRHPYHWKAPIPHSYILVKGADSALLYFETRLISHNICYVNYLYSISDSYLNRYFPFPIPFIESTTFISRSRLIISAAVDSAHPRIFSMSEAPNT